MEFRILGPVEVHGETGQARLGGGRAVALLAGLVLHANRTVSFERLTRAVWGDNPPSTATAALHTYIFRLRKALADAEPEGADRIVTSKTGYLLQVQPGELDLEIFRDYVERGRTAAGKSQWDQAVTELEAALSLWRGTALSGVTGDLVRQQAETLDDEYLSATEQLIETRLARGENDDLIPELSSLVAAHPLRERLREQSMLVLYRCGRQAEALAVYQDIYRLLSAEFGIQPGAPLQALHQRILVADPTLSAQETGRPVPRQLPTNPPNFTGRADYLAQLDALLESDEPEQSCGAVVISAIEGVEGVGKTALALHWAHRVAPRMSDGQLYVNLRGNTTPMEPSEALARFLSALGVPRDQTPVDQDEQAAMYRSLMAGKKTLVVLDNAATAGQVRPLLPGSSSCLVLITSRGDLRGLAALDGARRLTLDVLTPAEAVSMVTRALGEERVRPEPDSVAQLAKACGYLPAALQHAAAHLASHPSQTIGGYLATDMAGRRFSPARIP
jgi:DNA-binding SARP family transcriptional activator